MTLSLTLIADLLWLAVFVTFMTLALISMTFWLISIDWICCDILYRVIECLFNLFLLQLLNDIIERQLNQLISDSEHHKTIKFLSQCSEKNFSDYIVVNRSLRTVNCYFWLNNSQSVEHLLHHFLKVLLVVD